MSNKILDEYVQVLNDVEAKWDKLQILVELGKELPDFDEELRNETNEVPQCTSQVYVTVSENKGSIDMKATADAHIVKGYIKIYLDAFNGYSIDEFLEHAQTDIEEFVQKTQIDSSFLSSRANAFGNIFLFMKNKISQLR